MVELLQTVIEFFRVQNFASTYSNPLDQFLYGIFFPSILLVILIYLLIQRIFPEHRGLAVLLGVSFYIFIIVYPPNAATSLYAAFAPIGAFWYLVVILIGIIYLFFTRFLPSDRARGGGGGGGARGMATAYRKAMGKEMPTLGSLTEVRRQLKVVEAQIAALEARKKDPNMSSGEKEKVEAEISALVREKQKLKDLAKIS